MTDKVNIMTDSGADVAQVSLADEEDGTLLTYVATAEVGGKLAQIGSRLIGSVVNKMAAEFFRRFTETLAKDTDKIC